MTQSNSKLDTDLLIAGGGTAGLATAIYARQLGYRCIIIEPQKGYLDKACGEGLTPSAVALLKGLGAWPTQAWPILGIRYVEGSQQAARAFAQGQGAGIRRIDLSAALQNRAAELGAEFHQARLSSFYDHSSHVEACGLRGRWLVGCDGLRSQVRKQLGVLLDRKAAPRFGLRQHFQVERSSPFVEVYWHNEFEVYVTPVAYNLVNVALLFGQQKAPFEHCLGMLPPLMASLQKPVDTLRGAGPFGRRARSVQKGNVFLVGDAAGFLDPITGEGNQLAMAAARELLLSLYKGEGHTYNQRWQSLIRNYWTLTASLLWLRRHPQLRKLLLPSLRAFPALFDLAFSLLSYRSRAV